MMDILDSIGEENHLDVYENRSELHFNGETTIFLEGRQSETTKRRYQRIINELENGFLDRLYDNNLQFDFSELDETSAQLLKNLVDGLTSEVGRGLVSATFLQLTVKTIAPEQSIRLHKGGTSKGRFSWVEGISLRRLDDNYNTPFLRDKGLLSLNKYGAMMTRTLAENYPYTQLYKAGMRGPFSQWISIVDAIESGSMNSELGLNYLLTLLKNRSDHFNQLTVQAEEKLNSDKAISIQHSFEAVKKLLMYFYENTKYSARAFEVVIHGFMQALMVIEDSDFELGPLTQMRSANKKHGNVGDIELRNGRTIIEAWDAKYGKPYLYDELSELKEKIEANPEVEIAGFIVDNNLISKPEIQERRDEYSSLLGINIYLFNFEDWVSFKIQGLTDEELTFLGKEWLRAVVETFSRKRINIAPIDEPCDGWLTDLIKLLS